MMTTANTSEVDKPPRTTGQQTFAQRPSDSAIADVFGAQGIGLGFGQPEPGTFKTYREMRCNPTGALAKAIAFGPIRGADWTIEAEEDVPESIVELVDAEFVPRREEIVDNALRAVEFGFQPFELVWAASEGQWHIDKFKPLLPDKTNPLTDEHGNYAGLDNDGVVLQPAETLWIVYDKECDNWYGRSRYENYRKFGHTAWKQIQHSQGTYAQRVACPVTVVHYPPGKSKNAAGVDEENYKIMQKLVADMARSKSVGIPNELMKGAEHLLRDGAKLADVRSWILDILESKGTHGGDFVTSLRYYDSLIFRAWLVPERVGTEGQYGTKAEASEHSDIAMMIDELTQREMLRYINRYAVNRFVRLNFGAQWKDKVRIKGKPLDDTVLTLYASIVSKVLSENPEILETYIDTMGMYERLGLPIKDVVPDRSQLPSDDDMRRHAEELGADIVGRD